MEATIQKDKKIYQVSELNREIRMQLEGRFRTVCVEGEISNYKKHSSGHAYLSLKDEQSQIGCVFFSRHNANLRFKPEDGLKVVVWGRISVYEPRGQYQVYIERMMPKGQGDLQLAFEQLRRKLEGEGLFDEDRKQVLPRFPAVVGVVTSPTGAAVRDIVNVIQRRFRSTEILLAPVRVQGEGAAEEIVDAIRMMNQLARADVLIVGRGGGSMEDLWAFNEESVVREIAASRIPVVSAVGHEVDWTISDLVADLRAPTPSAAAELVVEDRGEIEQRVKALRDRMTGAAVMTLETRRTALNGLVSSYALRQPLHLVQQYSQRVDEILRQLVNYSKSSLNEKRHAFRSVAGQLNALSPLGVLERGYSITRLKSGKVVLRGAELSEGETIETKLADGTLESVVTRVRA